MPVSVRRLAYGSRVVVRLVWCRRWTWPATASRQWYSNSARKSLQTPVATRPTPGRWSFCGAWVALTQCVRLDCRLVIASRFDRCIYVADGDRLELYADLSDVVTGYLGDMAVDSVGRLYVDDTGSRVLHGEPLDPRRVWAGNCGAVPYRRQWKSGCAWALCPPTGSGKQTWPAFDGLMVRPLANHPLGLHSQRANIWRPDTSTQASWPRGHMVVSFRPTESCRSGRRCSGDRTAWISITVDPRGRAYRGDVLGCPSPCRNLESDGRQWNRPGQ